MFSNACLTLKGDALWWIKGHWVGRSDAHLSTQCPGTRLPCAGQIRPLSPAVPYTYSRGRLREASTYFSLAEPVTIGSLLEGVKFKILIITGEFFFPLKGSLTSKAEISGTVGCDFWWDLPTQCSGIKSIPSANQMSGNVCLKEPNLLRQEIHWESFPSRHDKLCLCFSWKGGCALNDSLWATSE